MKSLRLVLLYGFLLWLIPFCVAVAMFPLKKAGAPLFETIMPVTLAACGVIFTRLYFRGPRRTAFLGALQVGIIWFAICNGIDLLMFTSGPMKMPFLDYMADIGLTYLIFPIITAGFPQCRDAAQA